MRIHSFGVVGFLLLTTSAFAFDSETDIKPGGSDFNHGKQVSGIACADDMAARPRNCVIVVDEAVDVQRVTIGENDAGYTLDAGKHFPLIRHTGRNVDRPKDGDKTYKVFGKFPEDTSCHDGLGDADEFDAEGITFAGGYYFVTGSHGCGRKTNKVARASSFLVARFAAEAAPGKEPAGEVSFRLSDAIRSDATLGQYLAHDLADQGTSIEGVAALGKRLYFGFRTPVSGSTAYILSVDADALFTDSADLGAEPAIALDLSGAGKGMGIRDLATVERDPDRLLILIGPALGEEGTYAVTDYKLGGQLGPITPIPAIGDGKAEGLLLIDRAGSEAKILVLHDGQKKGGPAISIVPLQR